MCNSLYVRVEELKQYGTLKTFDYEGVEIPFIDSAVLEAVSKCKKYTKEELVGKADWLYDGNGWKCSSCGYGVFAWNNTPYCPKCGKKMVL